MRRSTPLPCPLGVSAVQVVVGLWPTRWLGKGKGEARSRVCCGDRG